MKREFKGNGILPLILSIILVSVGVGYGITIIEEEDYLSTGGYVLVGCSGIILFLGVSFFCVIRVLNAIFARQGQNNSKYTKNDEICETDKTDATIICPDCGIKIVNDSEPCPNCGCPSEFLKK